MRANTGLQSMLCGPLPPGKRCFLAFPLSAWFLTGNWHRSSSVADKNIATLRRAVLFYWNSRIQKWQIQWERGRDGRQQPHRPYLLFVNNFGCLSIFLDEQFPRPPGHKERGKVQSLEKRRFQGTRQPPSRKYSLRKTLERLNSD